MSEWAPSRVDAGRQQRITMAWVALSLFAIGVAIWITGIFAEDTILGLSRGVAVLVAGLLVSYGPRRASGNALHSGRCDWLRSPRNPTRASPLVSCRPRASPSECACGA